MRSEGGAVSFGAGLPPSVNHQYARTRVGVRLTRAAKVYRDALAWEVRALVCEGVQVPEEGDLSIDVRIVGAFEWDGDNRLKLLTDAVASGLLIDDRRFSRHTVERVGGEGEPCCEVTVSW